MRLAAVLYALLAGQVCSVLAIYVPLHEYRGATFFDGWDYWGNVDNTTWGNVTYLAKADAMDRQLTHINAAGNAILKVDNSTTILNATLVNRPAVRITTQESYGVGTLWVLDAVHLPYGCSVWPSFWSLGSDKEWPYGGEIDIIEGINLMTNNQMALHTTQGCFQAPNNVGQTGITTSNDCSTPQGCVVAENRPNSYGQGFAQAGGGVWAVQLDVSGVYMWFWSRPNVPQSIQTATSQSSLDTASFGPPSAAYPASGCNITQHFGPQQLILTITLCGVWAGVPSIYSHTCPGNCVYDNVVGPGSPKYDNAYFEIPYIRIYNTMDASSSSSPGPSSTHADGTVTTVITKTATATTTGRTSSSAHISSLDFTTLLLGAITVSLWVGSFKMV